MCFFWGRERGGAVFLHYLTTSAQNGRNLGAFPSNPYTLSGVLQRLLQVLVDRVRLLPQERRVWLKNYVFRAQG